MDPCRFHLLLAFALLALASRETTAPTWLEPFEHATAAIEAATLYRLDPVQLVALAWEESRFDASAVSPAGACGATQVLPRFAPGVTCDDLKDVRVAYHIAALQISAWRERCPAAPLECFNAGNNPGPAARRYAARIERSSAWIRRFIQRASGSCTR